MLELNKLYNMDCMEGMAQFPDNFFELAIVDPPYGVGSITYMPHKRTNAVGGYLDEYSVTIATFDALRTSTVKKKYMPGVVRSDCGKDTIKNFGDENVSPGPEYFAELFRVSKNQIIWGGNYYLLPPSRCYIIWDKGISEDFLMAMCEQAWTSFADNAKIIKGIYADKNRTQSKEARIHPTQKPVELYSWILGRYAKPGDKILDTHVGSASSLIACHNAGYEYVGFEIDEDYYNAATERMEAHLAQMTMNLFE